MDSSMYEGVKFMQVILKRGTSLQNDNYIGPQGSLTIDTTNQTLRLHDGVTPGGYVLAKLSDVIDQSLVESIISGQLFLHATSTDHDGLYYRKAEVDALLESLNVLPPVMENVNITSGNINGQDVTLMVGADYGWNDITSPIIIRGSGNASPVLDTFRNGILGYKFAGSKLQEAWGNFHILHDYAMGTMIYPHFHWSIISNLGGTIDWGFEYTIAKGHNQATGSVFEPTGVFYKTETIEPNSAYKHMVTEPPEGQGLLSELIEPDSMVLIRVFRAGNNDTFTGDAYLFRMDLHYQVARQSTKNRKPNFFM